MNRFFWTILVLLGLSHQLTATFFSRRLGRSHISGSPFNIRQEENNQDIDCNSEHIFPKQRLMKSLRLRGGAIEKDEKNEKVKGTCIGIDLGTTYR